MTRHTSTRVATTTTRAPPRRNASRAMSASASSRANASSRASGRRDGARVGDTRRGASSRGRSTPRARGRATRALDPAEADDFEITARLATVTLRTRLESASPFAWRQDDGGVPESVTSSATFDERDEDDARLNLYAGRYVFPPSVPPTSRNEECGS